MPQTRNKNRLIRCGIIALALLAALPGSPEAAEQAFDEAVAAYERGDYAAAMRGFRVLAEQGNAAAQLKLGLMYDNGRGVPRDYQEALKWYRLAAEQGNAAAQFNLGAMYASGVGVPLDYQEAVRWYRLAAEQGYAGAQHNLGLKYEYGDGVPQDYQEAVRWYRLAAEQGNGSYSQFAQYRLRVMYSKLGDKYAYGEGVPEDDAEAAKWYRKAAEQGDAAAQFNLGVMYAKGEGVPENDAEAAKWYRLAAEQGDAKAQFNLGVMYAKAGGEGVLEAVITCSPMPCQGRGRAGELCRGREVVSQGRRAGGRKAQFNLGVMYANGEGVLEDYVLAYAWWNLAAARGHKKADEAKDTLRLRMTADQIARAQKLSATIFDRINQSR